MKAEEVNAQVEKFYSSTDMSRYGDIINECDQTGVGVFPEFTTELREDGSEYVRGDKKTMAEATHTRNTSIL